MGRFRVLIGTLGVVAAVTAGSAALAATRGIEVKARATGATVALYAESHALVIGVSDYTGGWPSLRGVREDIPAVKAALERQGFAVEVAMDPDRDGLDRAFRSFIARHGQKPDNRLLFYYAGHGHTMKLAYGGQMGYLVPREAPNPNIDPSGFQGSALAMQTVETYALTIQSKHALFVFDACFAGAIFDATRAIPEVIAEKTGRPVRQFITSGTADQQVPDTSIFRRQFEAALAGEGDLDRDGYVTGAELGQFLETQVTNYSRRAQTPRYGKLRDPLLDKGDFVFALPGAAAPTSAPAAAAPGAASVDALVWSGIQASANARDFEIFARSYPNSPFAPFARARLEELRAGQVAAVRPAPVPAAPSPVQPAVGVYPRTFKPGDTFKDCPDCPEMVVVPAGAFDMGDLDGSGQSHEKPVHRVTIPRPFAVGKYEVTQAEWVAVMGSNPSHLKGDRNPVEQVSWNDAKEFVKRLSAKTGKSYRLLSEAEWEYAARAGSRTKYPFGDSESGLCEYGNVADLTAKEKNSGWTVASCRDGHVETAAVGSFKPNAFGLYDTVGNVWEWVEDCYNDSYNGAPTDGGAWTAGNCAVRVLRGGSWNDEPRGVRSALRNRYDTDFRIIYLGFRVARTL